MFGEVRFQNSGEVAGDDSGESFTAITFSKAGGKRVWASFLVSYGGTLQRFVIVGKPSDTTQGAALHLR
jgi:hypothetical protein